MFAFFRRWFIFALGGTLVAPLNAFTNAMNYL